MQKNGFSHKISFQLCSGLLPDLAVAAPADGTFHSPVFLEACFIIKHPVHVGLESVTALLAQGLHLFLLAVFHLAPFGLNYIDKKLIPCTDIANGHRQVKKILP